MSFGNSSGRGSFDKKKSAKRKKQEFHTHKLRFTSNETPLDFESLRTKVSLSLAHLGEQRFSQEPGGYTFENWMKSFNLLLDDFETKIGPTNLPKDYFEMRQNLASSLFQPVDLSELDVELGKLKEEEQRLRRSIVLTDVKNRVSHETEERNEKIRELEEEREAHQKNLDELRKRLAVRRKQTKDSSSLFRRFVSSLSTPQDQTPVETLEARAGELEAKVEACKRKIAELEKRIEKSKLDIDDGQNGEETRSKDELVSRLDEVDSKIEELDNAKLEQGQLAEKRKEVTSLLSEQIAKISMPSAAAHAKES